MVSIEVGRRAEALVEVATICSSSIAVVVLGSSPRIRAFSSAKLLNSSDSLARIAMIDINANINLKILK